MIMLWYIISITHSYITVYYSMLQDVYYSISKKIVVHYSLL